MSLSTIGSTFTLVQGLVLVLSVKMIGGTIAQFVGVASYSHSSLMSVGQDSSKSILFEIESLAHFPEMVVCKSVGRGSFIGRHHGVEGGIVFRSGGFEVHVSGKENLGISASTSR